MVTFGSGWMYVAAVVVWGALLPGCGKASSSSTPGGEAGSISGLGGAAPSEGGAAPSEGGASPGPIAGAGTGGDGEVCIPKADACSPRFECGSVDDGCGQEVSCGTCPGEQLCREHECVEECVGCVVGTACIGDGGADPEDPCFVCEAGRGVLVAKTGGACDDGDACTADDQCQAGACRGRPKVCADAVACNGTETCRAETGECAPGIPTCQVGVCDPVSDSCVVACGGCTIDQVCYPDGAVNPSNPCQACVAVASTAGWTATPGVSCGTNTTCAYNYVCSTSGECQSQKAASGEPCAGATASTECTAYACDGAGSCVARHAPKDTPCGALPVCQKADHCDGVGNCEDGGPEALGTSCKLYATCAGEQAAPVCSCVAGAKPSGEACVDVDECAEKADDCDSSPDACVNDLLSYHCACSGNFTGSGVGEDGCRCEQEGWSPLCEPWTQVALQNGHACGISAGALFCWGKNNEGQVGTGDLTDRHRPTRIGTLADWDFVAVGYEQSCAIRAGALYCWGDNAANRLGIEGTTSSVPSRVGTATDWVSVAAGLGTQCATRQNGDLYCWGWNSHGQVGIGVLTPFVTAPALVPTLSAVSRVSLQVDNVCAVAAGKLYCWGGDLGGELGTGLSGVNISTPTRVGSFGDALDVSVGALSACATRQDGSIQCWGSNFGSTPIQARPPEQWRSVSTSTGHCALKQSGAAYCWGARAIGDGTSALRQEPTEIAGGHAWEQLVTNDGTSCGIRDGGLYCWGSNEDGIRATGYPLNQLSGASWSRVSVGIGYSCAVSSEGELWCWGNYPGSTPGRPSSWTPTLIGSNGDDWSYIDAGYYAACGIRDGSLYCWGANTQGQVGNGTTQTISAPTAVGPTGLWQSVSVGDTHACGIRDGSVYCWGGDGHGQLGNGAAGASTTPESIAAGGWTQVAAGGEHSCGIRSGAMYCWGDDSSGQVGNGSATSAAGYPGPVRVGSASDWVAVSAGYAQSCGIQQNGTLSCWGQGQASPTAVTWPKPFKAETGEGYSTCALQDDGQLVCWGLNQFGQLGIGDYSYRPSPQASFVGDFFADISLTLEHACAVTKTGNLRCWGNNDAGQLGSSIGLLPAPVTP